jgi:hypothetical protein
LSRAPADRQAELAAARDAALAALRQREFGAAMSAVRQLAALQAAGGGADSAHAHAELGDLWSLLADYPAAQASYTRAVGAELSIASPCLGQYPFRLDRDKCVQSASCHAACE